MAGGEGVDGLDVAGGAGTAAASPWVAATWAVWVPTRTASAVLPQVVFAGAPVWLSVPPWHITQFVFQVAPWHWAQEVVAVPPTPSSAVPWHPWQFESPPFAE